MLESQWLKYKYKRQYGEIAPRPNERLQVAPTKLEYSISASGMYDDDKEYPRFGVLAGSWDEQKGSWSESKLFGSLRNRFVDDVPWQETYYYQYAASKIESGGSVGYLDGPHTKANPEAYLRSHREKRRVDRRPRESSPDDREPPGVESIPVWVKFRHAEW